ncbi:hypothetical protein TNCV_4796821 [Trichonephila clavipes]|nr:hypothetical protein TNCV_4796821 [Trichonephila clavipes]
MKFPDLESWPLKGKLQAPKTTKSTPKLAPHFPNPKCLHRATSGFCAIAKLHEPSSRRTTVSMIVYDRHQEEEPMDWEDTPFLSEVSAPFVPSRPSRKMRSLISVQVSEPPSLSANRFPNMRALVPKPKLALAPYNPTLTHYRNNANFQINSPSGQLRFRVCRKRRVSSQVLRFIQYHRHGCDNTRQMSDYERFITENNSDIDSDSESEISVNDYGSNESLLHDFSCGIDRIDQLLELYASEAFQL